MKLPLLLLALIIPSASVFSQTKNEAALKAALAEKQILDTPQERERIKQTCLAETQAWLDKNYDAWAAAHYKSEMDNMNWNNPDGSYGDATGWANMETMMKPVMKSEPKDPGKLSHLNHVFLIRGNMAYVYFDQLVVQADGKTGKAKEHRILLYDGRDGNWKMVGMNAFWDHSAANFAQKPVPDGAYSVLSAQYGDQPAKTIADNDKRIFKIFKDGYWIAPWSMAKDSAFYGVGGGTYTFKAGKYEETLSFYSWDSTAVGQTYPFDYAAEGKFYHQWGKINSDKYPDLWIDEMMQRVETATPLKNKGLEGVWFLESGQWGDLNNQKYDRKTTPDEVAMKIYAYPMVAYCFWNKKTGSFSAAGGGKYQFDGKVSTERIEFSSWGKPGTTYEINISLGEGTYTQTRSTNREVWRKAPGF